MGRGLIRWPTRRSKYHAKPTVVDGIRFHSAREAARYLELRLLQKAGEIVGEIETQPPFPLIIANRFGEDIKIGHYFGDFLYTRADGEVVCEDIKGVDTALSKLKRKLVAASYGLEVRVIR